MCSSATAAALTRASTDPSGVSSVGSLEAWKLPDYLTIVRPEETDDTLKKE